MGEVRLRPYAATDLADLLASFRDDEIKQWNPGPTDETAAREWYEARNDWTSGAHASWALTDHSDRLLGSVSLHRIDLPQLAAEVGYWVSPWARGRGVATRGVRLALTYGFVDLGLHRITLCHATENAASCAVARRTGFRLEGETKRSYRYADGVYRDEHLHAVLADEWNA